MADAKMVSLKETKAEAKTKGLPCVAGSGDKPGYPWGTELRFDSKRLIERLGLNDLSAGDEVRLEAKAKVTSVSTTASDKGDDYMSMSIQLTNLKVMDVNDYNEGFEEA